MTRPRLLLTSVFGPYGVKDAWGEALGCQMELLNNQITRCQGIHSPRQSYWSFALYLMAENLSIPTTVLDFPDWGTFTREVDQGGYTHVGISFIVPNVLKARRMALYLREKHPDIKILLGGYGTIIPDLAEIVPHDAACAGEGVAWLRRYFGEDENAPLRHPALVGPALEYLYGKRLRPSGGILMPGLGCENGCVFCVTSHKFHKCYIPLLKTGRDVFEACLRADREKHLTGFSVMDENFLKQPARARELLAEMEAHGKPYVFDLFSSAETIRALGVDFLVRLGVRMVWIGVESRFATHPKTRGIDLRALIRELQDHGIIVQASMILFQDHHTPENIWEDIDWAISLDSSLAQFMNYTPYPGTALYRAKEAEGTLKPVHYRHQHGQGELVFEHPAFPDSRDHARILREAFRRKYLRGGPGIVNMARTLVTGLIRNREAYESRRRDGLVWDPDQLRYVPSPGHQHPVQDRFMRMRLLMSARMAARLRPALLPALVYAPNRAARRKTRETMRLYREALGPATMADRIRGLALVLTGGLELLRLGWNRLLGRESIVRQPPCRVTRYRWETATIVDSATALIEDLQRTLQPPEFREDGRLSP